MLLSWLGGTDQHHRFLPTYGTVRERRDTAVHKENENIYHIHLLTRVISNLHEILLYKKI